MLRILSIIGPGLLHNLSNVIACYNIVIDTTYTCIIH